jgi:hypothetical protein
MQTGKRTRKIMPSIPSQIEVAGEVMNYGFGDEPQPPRGRAALTIPRGWSNIIEDEFNPLFHPRVPWLAIGESSKSPYRGHTGCKRSCHAIPEGQNRHPGLFNNPLNEKNIPDREIVNQSIKRYLASQRAEKSVNADVFGQKRSTDRRRIRPCPVSSWSDSVCRSKALYEPSNRLITSFSPALFLLMAVNYQCMPLSIAKGIAITVTTKPQKIALSDSKSTRANAASEILL